VFGGRANGTRFADAWEWDPKAQTWLKLPTAVDPSGRSGMALAADPTGAIVAINGDSNLGATLIGVFRLSSELSTRPREACREATIDADRDGFAGCADPDCWLRCQPTCPPGTAGCPTTRPHCGDHICDGFEDYLICPTDCTP
jgi:hypothetical protein